MKTLLISFVTIGNIGLWAEIVLRSSNSYDCEYFQGQFYESSDRRDLTKSMKNNQENSTYLYSLWNYNPRSRTLLRIHIIIDFFFFFYLNSRGTNM